jgi:hypothetical protein
MRACVGAMVLVTLASGAAAQDGESLFQSECAYCHDLPTVLGWMEAEPAAEHRAYLEALLPDHFAPDDETRAAIIDHLLEEAG